MADDYYDNLRSYGVCACIKPAFFGSEQCVLCTVAVYADAYRLCDVVIRSWGKGQLQAGHHNLHGCCCGYDDISGGSWHGRAYCKDVAQDEFQRISDYASFCSYRAVACASDRYCEIKAWQGFYTEAVYIFSDLCLYVLWGYGAISLFKHTECRGDNGGICLRREIAGGMQGGQSQNSAVCDKC